MKATEIIAFVIVYLVMCMLTYKFLRFMIISSLDYADKEDREILEDEKTMFFATALISSIWFIYIPYLFVSSAVSRYKNNTEN